MKKICVVCLMLALCLCLCSCKSSDYKNALAQFEAGEYQKARDVFAALEDYEDASELLKQCDYQIALSLMKEERYEEAKELFASLGEYEDSADQVVSCVCAMSRAYAENGKMKEAVAILVDFYENPQVEAVFCEILLDELAENYLPNVQSAIDSWNEYLVIWMNEFMAIGKKTAVGASITPPKVDEAAPQVAALRRSIEKADKSIADIREAYDDEVMKMCAEDIQALRNTVFESAETIDNRFSDLDGWAVTTLFYGLQDKNYAKANNGLIKALYNVEDAVETVKNNHK